MLTYFYCFNSSRSRSAVFGEYSGDGIWKRTLVHVCCPSLPTFFQGYGALCVLSKHLVSAIPALMVASNAKFCVICRGTPGQYNTAILTRNLSGYRANGTTELLSLVLSSLLGGGARASTLNKLFVYRRKRSKVLDTRIVCWEYVEMKAR